MVVPTAEIAIDDTWHVLGLEGTASKDVVAKDLFVPAGRAVDTRAMMRGDSPHSLKHATNLYRVSSDSMLSLSVVTAILGSAKYALAEIYRADQGAARGRYGRAQGRARADPTPAR